MANQGIHHLGLATHDMEKTLEFYENVLGFRALVCEMIQPEQGGAIRHAFLDAGDGSMLAFMEFNEIPQIAGDFDAGINRGLGLPGGIYHFAFKVANEEELAQKRLDLLAKDVEVTEVVDHQWCKSIYFFDPNHIQLEFCCLTEALTEAHREARQRAEWTRHARS